MASYLPTFFLHNIIDKKQTGCIKGIHLSNNIRLILDMLDIKEYILENNFILFIDFHTAFNTIEHIFLFKVSEFFGFGSYFLKSFFKIHYTKDAPVL